MSDKIGRVSYLPTAVAAADPDEFLSDVLTGWKRQQLAQNFSLETAKRRSRSVMRMASFVGKHPWEWLPRAWTFLRFGHQHVVTLLRRADE